LPSWGYVENWHSSNDAAVLQVKFSLSSVFRDGQQITFDITTLATLAAGDHTLLLEVADTNDHELDSTLFISDLRTTTNSGGPSRGSSGTSVPEPANPLLFGGGLMALRGPAPHGLIQLHDKKAAHRRMRRFFILPYAILNLMRHADRACCSQPGLRVRRKQACAARWSLLLLLPVRMPFRFSRVRRRPPSSRDQLRDLSVWPASSRGRFRSLRSPAFARAPFAPGSRSLS